MSETSIEWTHPHGFKGATWNPVVGCRRVSPGCENCYAETMGGRLARMGQARYLDVMKVDEAGQPRGRWNGKFREVPEVLDLPLRTRTPTCYFVNSMSDLFGEGVSDGWIAAVFGVMAACPQHRFLILTKRAERMAAWFARRVSDHRVEAITQAERILARAIWTSLTLRHLADGVLRWPLPNVWIGVSAEDQQRADERIPHLLRVPAAVRFLSVEPQLGPVDLSKWIQCPYCDGPEADYHTACINPIGLRWVIQGGESGPGARPFDLAWARSIRDQCKAAGVAYFLKQLGAWPTIEEHGRPEAARERFALKSKKGGAVEEWPKDLRVRQWPDVRS